MNTLYYGDNLDVLRRHIKDETVDLVYLDPPFKSDQQYNVLFKEQDGSRAAAQIEAFEDTWHWDQTAVATYEDTVRQGGNVSKVLQAFHTFLSGGERTGTDMLAYLSMMAPRLMELRRVLKPSGSLYLHCDPTASHYLKMLLDAVFSPEDFQNEIIWKRTNARSTVGRWPRVHDVLLFYTKGEGFFYNSLKVAADKAKMPHTLITGADGKKYQTYELTAPGATQKGESGKPWRGFNPTRMGRHWANNQATMEAWDKRGLIHWPKDKGFPRRRDEQPFDEEARMTTVADVWTDIDRLNQTAKERLGYPTQKPEALMERILQASSKEGDLVLDPFCGCGTTVAVAQRLNRPWVGIDITFLAISLIRRRLRDAHGPDVDSTYKVIGEPVSLPDAEALAQQNAYQFQFWALDRVGARSADRKKGADRGIDGRLIFFDEPQGGEAKQIILSVKSGHTGRAHVHELRGVMEREEAEIGILISLQEPTQPMREEAASAGFYESPVWGRRYPRLQLLTITDLLAGKGIDYPPQAQVNVTFRKAPKAATPEAEQVRLVAEPKATYDAQEGRARRKRR